MAITLVSWNTEGRLTRFSNEGRGSPEHIVDTLSSMNGDVVFLAEASDSDQIERNINDTITKAGYSVHTVPYEDAGKDRRWSAEKAPNMKLLTRLPVKSFRQIRLGGVRNALEATIEDPDTGIPMRFFGVHLDDRSEAYRLIQTNDLLGFLAESDVPTVVMGDFNAMHAEDMRAKFLRSSVFRAVTKVWPHARTKDMFIRLSDMGAGTTLRRLQEDGGLSDADAKRKATTTPKLRGQEWLPSIPVFQIDHVYGSAEVTVRDFQVWRDGGSDHRPLRCIIQSQ